MVIRSNGFGESAFVPSKASRRSVRECRNGKAVEAIPL